jgi:hypothetical protein
MQDGFIFSDTIARNIAPGEEFIESLPLAYNTKISSEGHGLSQGQKQRILIARAVYVFVVAHRLRTVTGKTLNFTGELTGEAEIITDDRNLFSRILSPPEYLLKNHLFSVIF